MFCRCTDSTRVNTHRRQHHKADNLMQSGYQQFKNNDNCGQDDCKYRARNTNHFHCLKASCGAAVLSVQGTETHTKKHEEMQENPNVE